MLIDNNQQNVTQNVRTNTGQIQAIAAGEDVYAMQQVTRQASETITQKQAIEVLSQIEAILKTANLHSEVAQETTKYVAKAKDEAQEEKPDRSIVIRQLERATSVIKKLDTTAGTTQDLISGHNIGISEPMKRDLISQGAIFDDLPGDRSEVLEPSKR